MVLLVLKLVNFPVCQFLRWLKLIENIIEMDKEKSLESNWKGSVLLTPMPLHSCSSNKAQLG